jgi:hypothetical protein
MDFIATEIQKDSAGNLRNPKRRSNSQMTSEINENTKSSHFAASIKLGSIITISK